MDELAEAAQDRHPAVRDIAQWFTFAHLSGRAQVTSQACVGLVHGCPADDAGQP